MGSEHGEAPEDAVAPPCRRLPSSTEELLASDPLALAPDRQLWLRGTVLSRRVLGRRLAYCTVKLEAEASTEGSGLWQPNLPPTDRGGAALHGKSGACSLCFSAALFDAEEAKEEGHDWAQLPQRRGDLPVGLRLEALVLLAPAVSAEPLVRRWRRLPAPVEAPPGGPAAGPAGLGGDRTDREPSWTTPSQQPPPGSWDLALHHEARNLVNQHARRELRNAIGPALCKVWFAGRKKCSDGCQFRHEVQGEEEERRLEARQLARQRSQAENAAELRLYDEVETVPHSAGGKLEKRLRAECFAAWLLQRYGAERLRRGTGVLDVAGGQGDLSWALSVDHGVPCTLVDPGLRREGRLKSWQRRLLRKTGREGFRHVPVEFGPETFGGGAPAAADGIGGAAAAAAAPHAELLRGASLVVGLHPDEATEAIVDLALAAGVHFAVIPCCVFANKFPGRELEPGLGVRTLNQFCSYLRRKDPGISEELLGFAGRNKVLYTS